MYSIVYIPTGVALTEIQPYIYQGCPTSVTRDFYCLKDCRKFLRNFIEYDKFQRSLKPAFRAFNHKWLSRNNRFTYIQYKMLFSSLNIVSFLDPNPAPLMKEEFTIIKTNRLSRIWTEV